MTDLSFFLYNRFPHLYYTKYIFLKTFRMDRSSFYIIKMKRKLIISPNRFFANCGNIVVCPLCSLLVLTQPIITQGITFSYNKQCRRVQRKACVETHTEPGGHENLLNSANTSSQTYSKNKGFIVMHCTLCYFL